MSNLYIDVSHLSLLEAMKQSIKINGPGPTKGLLMRSAISMANLAQEDEYLDEKEWEEAVGSGETVLAMFEGKATKEGEFYYLETCPFGTSIKTYKQLCDKLPAEYAQVKDEFNKPTGYSKQYRVGSGAGVSPFCVVHQTLRSCLGDKVKVGDKLFKVYQLGCKAGDGKKGFADVFINELKLDKNKVDKLLDKSMCVYAIKLVTEEEKRKENEKQDD